MKLSSGYLEITIFLWLNLFFPSPIPQIMKPSESSTPTMQTIASQLGVSRMTVSFALNGTGRVSQEMRQKVLDLAHELDFRPNLDAQRLKGQRPNNVELFVLWLEPGAGSSKIRFIQELLKARGYNVPVHCAGLRDSTSESNQAEILAALRHQKPRALVAASGGLHRKALDELRRYQDEGGILATYDHATDLLCDQTVFDRVDNTYRATRHLLDLGHRDVGIGFHANLWQNDLRYRGYQRALREFGLEPRANWGLEGLQPEDYASAGVTMAQKFLSLRVRPTAMAILNDYAAMAFLSELRRAGVECPRDLSVVGHDDHPLSRYNSVPLSTVTHPARQIAESVAQHLISRLEGYDGPPRATQLQGELVQRDSAQALHRDF